MPRFADQKNVRTIQIRKSFCLKAVKFPKVIDDMTRKEGMPQLSQRNLATNIVEVFIVMNLLTPPPQNICNMSQENERHEETIQSLALLDCGKRLKNNKSPFPDKIRKEKKILIYLRPYIGKYLIYFSTYSQCRQSEHDFRPFFMTQTEAGLGLAEYMY